MYLLSHDAQTMKEKENQRKMSMKNITLEFATSTSMKGVPRILKSDRKILKCLWASAVLILLVICGQQCYLILNEFFSHPKTTSVYSKEMRFDGTDPYNAPNVILCNLNAFSSEAYNVTGTSSVPMILGFKFIVSNNVSHLSLS